MQSSRSLVAVIAAVGACALVACSGSQHPSDERGWFRSYTQRVAQNMRSPSEIGLVPLADPYIGSCVDHRASVSWQATLSLRPGKQYRDTVEGRHDVLQTVLGRADLVSRLPAERRSMIAASHADPRATDTLVLEPSDDSRVQVSVPDPTVLLAVGYVSC